MTIEPIPYSSGQKNTPANFGPAAGSRTASILTLDQMAWSTRLAQGALFDFPE
jgi:hypothetical protein